MIVQQKQSIMKRTPHRTHLLASAPNIGCRLWLELHQSAWNITNQATRSPGACADDDLTMDWNSPGLRVETSEGNTKRGYGTTSEQTGRRGVRVGSCRPEVIHHSSTAPFVVGRNEPTCDATSVYPKTKNGSTCSYRECLPERTG